jgi:hypothetical protein
LGSQCKALHCEALRSVDALGRGRSAKVENEATAEDPMPYAYNRLSAAAWGRKILGIEGWSHAFNRTSKVVHRLGSAHDRDATRSIWRRSLSQNRLIGVQWSLSIKLAGVKRRA